MPTIIVRTGRLTPVERRAVAVRLTRWFTKEGVRPAHRIVVRFETSDEGTIFTGGFPVEAIARDNPGPAHASVTCCVSVERDDAFRLRLAGEIVAALPGGPTMTFLYVEFQPTASSDVLIARRGVIFRAGGIPAEQPAV